MPALAVEGAVQEALPGTSAYVSAVIDDTKTLAPTRKGLLIPTIKYVVTTIMHLTGLNTRA